MQSKGMPFFRFSGPSASREAVPTLVLFFLKVREREGEETKRKTWTHFQKVGWGKAGGGVSVERAASSWGPVQWR